MSTDLDKLTEPFPKSAHKQRAVQGKGFTYVEGHTVIHRLNAATGNNWNLEIKSLSTVEINADWKQVTAHVALTIPGLGTREHIGIQDVHVKGADLVKGAITDALKKAATLFGVGLELYGPDYEAVAPGVRAPAPSNPDAISREDVKRIWVKAKGKIPGKDDEVKAVVHKMMDGMFRKTSSKDLTQQEAKEFLRQLDEMKPMKPAGEPGDDARTR